MAVCIICKSDEDLIKNEVAIVWTLFSCLLDPQGQVTHANSRNWAKILLVQHFKHVQIFCKFDEDPSEMKSLSARQHFHHAMSMGA